MTRKERRLRKLMDNILRWAWPDEEIEELIELAHKIEWRRAAQAVERGVEWEKATCQVGRIIPGLIQTTAAVPAAVSQKFISVCVVSSRTRCMSSSRVATSAALRWR